MRSGPSFSRGSGGSTISVFGGREKAGSRGTAHLAHDALLYSDIDEYLAGIRHIALAGLEADEPVLIAVPEPRLGALRSSLGGLGGSVTFVDMRQHGRNPGRILPLIRAFADEHADRRVRFVSEPIWPQRAPAEIVEGHRHEALVNLGLAGCDAHVVCPYDTRGLEPSVVDEALRTHPTALIEGERRVSPSFADPLTVYAAADHPLSEAPDETVEISLHEGLYGVRRD